MPLRHPTIRDVAKSAGVSITTVSYVFTGRPGISEDTRKRVLAAATALHYSPNALIRSLQRRRTNTIGAYLWETGADAAEHIEADLIRGIRNALAETEYDLLVYAHHKGRFDAANISAFLDKRVDGLIWTPAPVAFGALDALDAAALPTVAVLFQPVPPGIGHVGVDNVGGAVAAVEHLVQLGHRRIAFSGSLRLPDFAERHQGYRKALRAAGLPIDSRLELAVLDGACRPDAAAGWASPEEALTRIREIGATAIFFASDAHALIFMRYASGQGVRIPQDLSVVGFDDTAAARLTSPGLTTVRLPATAAGAEAVRHLIRLIDGEPASSARSMLPVELVVRGSTAPPPQ